MYEQLNNVEKEIMPEDAAIEMKLKNSVDEDVKSMFLPIKNLQSAVFYPKYFIKNNFIYPNDFINICISLCCSSTLFAIKSYRIYDILHDEFFVRYTTMKVLFVALYLDVCLSLFIYTVDLVLSSFKSKKYVLFLLKFQMVHRLLNAGLSVTNVISSWIYCILLFIFHIFVAIIYSFLLAIQWHVSISLFAQICNDANIVYAIVSMKLLTEKVVQWNIKVSQRDDFHETPCEELLKAYINILECYDLFTDVFQLPVRTILKTFRC